MLIVVLEDPDSMRQGELRCELPVDLPIEKHFISPVGRNVNIPNVEASLQEIRQHASES